MQSRKYVNRDYPIDALSKGNKQSAEYLQMLRTNQQTGNIDPQDLIEVQQQLAELNSDRAGLNIEWKQLGPDNFGGRTRALIYDNQDATGSTAFAASVTGGIFKSTDNGTTWSKINNATSNLKVSCMVQTPSGDIYVGTGESFSANKYSGIGQMGYSSGFMGTGIYKSTDGENFTLISSTAPEMNNKDADFAFVNEVAFDEASGNLYAATNTGLKYSSDNGSSWATAKDSDGNELTENATDVQASNGVVIASVNNMAYAASDGNPDAFILRSYDGAESDSVGVIPVTNVKRIEFAIAPSDNNIVYASVVNQFEDIYNVYKSEDKGQNWSIVLPGSESLLILGGQGVYNNFIKVFPDNPTKLLIGGITLWVGEKVQEDGFYAWKSISQGFVNMLDDYVHVDIHTLAINPVDPNRFLVGTDGGIYRGTYSSGQFTYTNGNRDYATTQFYSVGYSGVYNRVIGGAQDNGSVLVTGNGNTPKQGVEIMGSQFGFQNGGDGGPAVISIINKDVLVASTTYGDVRRSDDSGENYSTNDQFLNGIGNINAFKTPMALWESFDNPNSRDSVWFYNRSNEVYKKDSVVLLESNNSNYPFYRPLTQDLEPGDSLQYVDPVSSRFFLATANHVYMTVDLHNFAKTPEWWEIANSDFTDFSGIPHCIAVSADANHVFFGTQSGELFRVSNLALAYNFERADISSPSSIVSVEKIPLYVPGTTDEITQIITSISIDPNDANNILVTLGNYGNDQYLMYSTDALSQAPEFASKQGNLPKMPVYSSLIEMKEGNIVLIGTENGIFTTENISASSPNWTADFTGMGNVPVFELHQQLVGQEPVTISKNGEDFHFDGATNKGLVYAATYGRGLLYTNKFWQPTTGVDEIVNGNNDKLNLKIYPNPATSVLNVDIASESNVNSHISVYDLSGRLVIETNRLLVKGENTVSLNISSLIKGTYIVKASIGDKVYTNKLMVN